MDQFEITPDDRENINDFSDLCHEVGVIAHNIAKSKGWWDRPRKGGAWFARNHYMLSEALEASRKHDDDKAQLAIDALVEEGLTTYSPEQNGDEELGTCIALMHSELSEAWFAQHSKSEKLPGYTAIEEEFADVFIRMADYCMRHQLDLGGAIKHKLLYNADRSYRHGGKKF